MNTEITTVIDHAARLLERTPGHCSSIADLHRQACRETGQFVSLSHLLNALAAQEHRFALIHTHPAAEHLGDWTESERAAYGPASGGSDFVVMLAQPPAPDPIRWPAAADPTGSPAEAALLGDVHDALTRVLEAAAADEALFRAAGAGVQELEAVHRRLRSPEP